MGVIELNVGGHHFITTRTTLCKHANSMLARMFSGDMTPALQDTQGRYFIDRSGEHFGTILAHLRNEPISVPTDHAKLQALVAEARYFQVSQADVEHVVAKHSRHCCHFDKVRLATSTPIEICPLLMSTSLVCRVW